MHYYRTTVCFLAGILYVHCVSMEKCKPKKKGHYHLDQTLKMDCQLLLFSHLPLSDYTGNYLRFLNSLTVVSAQIFQRNPDGTVALGRWCHLLCFP